MEMEMEKFFLSQENSSGYGIDFSNIWNALFECSFWNEDNLCNMNESQEGLKYGDSWKKRNAVLR